MSSTTRPRCSSRSGASYLAAGSGEPVVLLHGVGLRAEAWAPQVEHLARSHRALAFDLPGHGESAPLAPGATVADFGAWFVAVLDDLGLARVNLAGHSMGALIAGWVAVRRPDRVHRAALVSAVHRRSPEATAAVRARAAELGAGRFDALAPLERWFPAGEYPAARSSCEGWLAQVGLDGYTTAYRAFAEGDDAFADAWRVVTCPVLCLTGALDPHSTPAMSRAMADAATRGEAVVVAGHRHMVGLTAADIVNAALDAWLTRKA